MTEKLEACPSCGETGHPWYYDAQRCWTCGWDSLRERQHLPLELDMESSGMLYWLLLQHLTRMLPDPSRPATGQLDRTVEDRGLIPPELQEIVLERQRQLMLRIGALNDKMRTGA